MARAVPAGNCCAARRQLLGVMLPGVLGLALAAPGLLTTARAQAPSLASIPVDLASPAGLAAAPPPGSTLRVRVHVEDVAGLAALLGLQPPAAGPAASAGSLTLVLAAGTHADVPTPPDARAATFIVDHDDPAVAGLGQQLRSAQPGRPVDAQAITAFVARVMQGSMAANAEFASEVARTLRGDCTEYALLTAALARGHGIPARIVHGMALLHADGQWRAYGHAWVQTYEAGRWTLRDSALAGLPADAAATAQPSPLPSARGPVFYLPALGLVDEGPGHRLQMMQGFRRMPSRIEVLEVVPAG